MSERVIKPFLNIKKLSSRKRLASFVVEQLPAWVGPVEQSQVSVILRLQCSLHFVGEVIVHFQSHVKDMIVLFLSSPGIADESKQDHVEFAQIKRVARGEVGVEDDACETEATEAPHILHLAEHVQTALVLLVSVVESTILLVPLDVFPHEFVEEIFVHRVFLSNLGSVGLSKYVFCKPSQEEEVAISLDH